MKMHLNRRMQFKLLWIKVAAKCTNVSDWTSRCFPSMHLKSISFTNVTLKQNNNHYGVVSSSFQSMTVCFALLETSSLSLFAAIDRSISSSLSDARDALVNAVVDCLTAHRANGSNIQPSGLIAPAALRLFPLYVLALLKQVGALYAPSEIHLLTTRHSKAFKKIKSVSQGEKCKAEGPKSVNGYSFDILHMLRVWSFRKLCGPVPAPVWMSECFPCVS